MSEGTIAPPVTTDLPDPSSCSRPEFARAAVRLYAEGGWIWDASPEDVSQLCDACVPGSVGAAGSARGRRPMSWRVSAKALLAEPDGVFARPRAHAVPPEAVARPAPASSLPSEAGASDAVPMLACLIGMGKAPEAVSAAAVVSAVHGAGVAWGALMSACGPGATARACEFAAGLSALHRACPHPLLLSAAALAASGGLLPITPPRSSGSELRSLSIDCFESAPVPARARPVPDAGRSHGPGRATRVVSVPDDGAEGSPWMRCVEVVKLSADRKRGRRSDQ